MADTPDGPGWWSKIWAKAQEGALEHVKLLAFGLVATLGLALWAWAKGAWAWLWVVHPVKGWALALPWVAVLPCAAWGLWALFRWWRPLVVTPIEATKSRSQTQVDPIVEEIDGVQWRCTLYDGKVHQLKSHCPKCFFRIDPKSTRVFRGEASEYRCDGCQDFEAQITGSSFKVEDRITRIIEAGWLKRQPGVAGGGKS